MLIKFPLKVVVMDDDEDICQIISHFLKNDPDLRIETFVDPKEACDYISDNDTDIAFVDINLTTAFGDQILRKLKSLDEGIAVVTMTADLNMITFKSCQNSGASYMLCKPINKSDLEGVIFSIKENFHNWNDQYQQLIKSRK